MTKAKAKSKGVPASVWPADKVEELFWRACSLMNPGDYVYYEYELENGEKEIFRFELVTRPSLNVQDCWHAQVEDEDGDTFPLVLDTYDLKGYTRFEWRATRKIIKETGE